jgi:TetR/AcrR family transcriptional repressor of nem operon
MPWQKSFDADAALEKAMAAFWAHGYEATSIQDLVDCMGVNRGSLYATFGDKRSLFLQALRRYDEAHRRAWTDQLAGAASARAAILAAFEDVIAAVLDNGRSEGCLLVNTALELSPHDPEIAAIVAGGLREVERFFRRQIERGRASGQISPDVDPEETARALLALLAGLRVFARARPEQPLLHSIARQAAALLDGSSGRPSEIRGNNEGGSS